MANTLLLLVLIPLGVLGLLGLLYLLSYAWKLEAQRRGAARSTWRLVASRLGLSAPSGGDWPLRGNLEGLRVGILEAAAGEESMGLYKQVEVTCPDLPPGLSIRAENLATRLKGALGDPDLQTGDPAFDAAILLAGQSGPTLAVLDAETRRLVAERIVKFEARVGAEKVCGVIPELGLDASSVAESVRELVRLGRRLSLAGRSVPALLVRNVMEDPTDGVRQRNLDVLIRDFRGTSETQRACAWAVEKAPDSHCRIAAARYLGAPSWPYCVGILESKDAHMPARKAALELLIEQMPPADLIPVLERVIAAPNPALWRPAVIALGRRRHPAVFNGMLEWLKTADAETTGAIAEALGLFGDVRAEPALIGLLKHPSADVKVAAADALGQVGTLRAIEPLLECETGSGLLRGRELRQWVRASIQTIQSRLGDLEVGRLTLVEAAGETGALSLARGGGQEGALSVARVETAAGAGAPAAGRAEAPAAVPGEVPRPEREAAGAAEGDAERRARGDDRARSAGDR